MAQANQDALHRKTLFDKQREHARLAVLRLPAVKARTGLSRSTVYLRMADGSFPKSISLGPRTIGWIETEIDDWLTQRILASRNSVA